MRNFFCICLLSIGMVSISLSASAQNQSPLSGNNPSTQQASPSQINDQMLVRVLDKAKNLYGLSLSQMVYRYEKGICKVRCIRMNESSAEFRVEMPGNPISIILLDDGM